MSDERPADPWAMYFVVRKDRPLAFGEGMALAGAATDACLCRFAPSEGWVQRPRKVALRADPAQLDEVEAVCDAVRVADTLLALAPMRMSDRPELLEALRPFTDARRPAEDPPAPDGPVMSYVIRAGVLKTLGKAMAQAGHAAQLAAESFGLGAWREAGRPGEVRVAADEDAWSALCARDDAVTVADAGLTQVAPGTVTVLALAPGSGAARDLERVP